MKKLLFFASAVAMFASCSKDLTEDVAPALSGENAIYASYEADSETRSHVDGTAAKWDNGDALGVFAAEAGDKTNAYFGYDGTKFVGSLKQVKGEDIFVYYPWSRDMAFGASDNKLTFEIPATQYYNHLYTEGWGSFVSGVVPAVAAAEEVDKSKDVNVTLQPVVSYLSIPIKGVGKVSKVELSMTLGDTSSATNVALTGDVVVDLANAPTTKQKNVDNKGKEVDDDTFFTISPMATASQEDVITLDCGDGVDLNPETAKYFMFVIPAYINLTDQVNFKISVVDEKDAKTTYDRTIAAGKLKSTYRNYILHYDSADITWSEGGAYIISNEYEFLMYADAATNGYDNVAYVVDAMWDEDQSQQKILRPAVIIKDLDFGEGFNTDPTLSKVDKNVADYLKDLLAAYVDNGKAIPTIGAGDDAVKFEIEGNVDGEAAEIKNLKVVGNGMFGGKAKIGNVVKNITLTNIEVEGDYLVTEYADAPVSMNQSTPFEKLEKITVNGGTIKSTNKNIAVVDKAYTRNLDAVKVNGELPAGAKYANTLYVSSNVNTPLDPALTFNTVKGVYSGKGKIVTVTAEGAKAFIDAIDVKASGANWFSVVEREAPATEGAAGAVKTSFWTGFVPADAPTGDVFTAEALAYAVKNRKPVVLTNDIDLMNGDWKKVADAAGYTSVNVNSKQPEAAAAAEAATTPAPAVVYTIKNVTLAYAEDDEYKPAHSSGYLSLFGYEAAVENIVVDGIVVDDANQPESVTNCYTAGLAHTGSAKNVTVKNAKINATKFSNSNKYHIEYTGVLFAYTESVENCTVVDSEVTGTKTIGYVAGLLGLTDKTVAEFKINGVKSGSNKTFGKIAVALPDNEKQTWTDVTFTDYAGSMAIEDFYVDGEKAHIIKLSINGKAGTLYTINPLAEEEEK